MVELEELNLTMQDLVLVEFVWIMFQIQCLYDVFNINVSVKNEHVFQRCSLVVVKDKDCIAKYPYAEWK